MTHGDGQTSRRPRPVHPATPDAQGTSLLDSALAPADIVLSTVAAGQTVSTTGTVRSGVSIGAAGLLTEPAGGDLVIFGPISGPIGDPGSGVATIGIATGATLYAAGPVSATVSASFMGTGGTLQLAGLYLSQMAAPIADFGAGAVIDVISQTLTDAVLSAAGGGETLTMEDEGSVLATLTLSDTAALGNAAYVVPDPVDGSRIVLGATSPALTAAAAGTPGGSAFAWGSAAQAGQWANPTFWRIAGGAGTALAPGANDTAAIAGPASSMLAVAGDAAAATLSTQGLVALNGNFAIGSLLVGAVAADTLLLGADSQLVATTATVSEGFLQIAAAGAVLDVTSATAVQGGTLWVADGGAVQTASLTLSGGTLRLGTAGTVGVNGAGGAAGSVAIAAGGTVAGAGAIDAPVQNDGVLRANGTLDVFGPVSGSGVIQIAAESEVYLASGAAAGQQVQFQAATGTAELFGSASSCAAIISGFGIGDVIDIASSTLSQAIWTPDVGGLTGTLDLGQAGTLDIATANGLAATSVQFTMAGDGLGGTAVQMIPCFVSGTRLARPGGSIAVEQIVPGDRLLTRSGAARRVRWIGSRHYAAATLRREPQLRPVRIKRGGFGDGLPSHDLHLSPQHAIALSTPAGLRLVPAVGLVDGRTIVRETPHAGVMYYHVELDEHDLLLSEGVAVESFVSTSAEGRDLFQQEYGQRGCAVRPIAPRLDHGPELERLRATLRLVPPPGAGIDCGWSGHIDRVQLIDSDVLVEGWAAYPAESERKILLRCTLNGQERGQVLANKWRPDLDRAGYGGGRCSFSAIFRAPDIQPSAHTVVELRSFAYPHAPVLSHRLTPAPASESSVP